METIIGNEDKTPATIEPNLVPQEENPSPMPIEEEQYHAFLSPSEKSRVTAKYQGKAFQDVFKDLKANVNDAILFVIDKYEPFIANLFWRQVTGKSGDFSDTISLDDMKNELYLYLSGAGISPVFYEKFAGQLAKQSDVTDDIAWRTFSFYVKHYFTYYVRKVIRRNRLNKGGTETFSLNKPVSTPSGNSEEGQEPTADKQSFDIEDVSSNDAYKNLTESEVIQKLFERFLLSLKTTMHLIKSKSAKKRRGWGEGVYEVIVLKAAGKSHAEIMHLTNLTKSSVYKALSKGRDLWLKFLNAHKTSEHSDEIKQQSSVQR